MTVIYYTATCYLDSAIEVINLLKTQVKLHVLIEITPASCIGNVLDIGILPNVTLISAKDLLSAEAYQLFDSYFLGCASVTFVIHENGFSRKTLGRMYDVFRKIKQFEADAIHIEVINIRTLALAPYLFSMKKVFLTMHDSIPHTGERNWKLSFSRFIFLRLPYSRKFFFYSKFSLDQFTNYYRPPKSTMFALKMFPYSFFRTSVNNDVPKREHILFFGRVSAYKGIEVLLRSIPKVLDTYPTAKFIIAGKSYEGYSPKVSEIKSPVANVVFINRYIENKELARLIQCAKVVVCPYLEATQSGVLMTSFALNTPVVATNVGAFPEYILNDVNGILVPPDDSDQLAQAIVQMLESDHYAEMVDNLSRNNLQKTWAANASTLSEAYFT